MFKGNNDIRYNQDIVLSNIFDYYRTYIYRVEGEEFFATKYLKVIYVIKGSIKIEFEDTSTTLNSGDVYYIGPNLCYKILQDENVNTMLILDLDPSYISNFCNECFDSTIPYNLNDYKDDIIIPMGEVYLLTIQQNEENIQSLLNQIIVKLKDSAKVNYTMSNSDSAKNIIYKVACYIKSNIDDVNDNNILLSDIADKFNVSYYYLSRNFKEVTGLNYSDFILKYKLNKAVPYLINTKDKISDITDISGFNDAKSFNQSFRNNFHITPSEFRLKYKNYNIDINSDSIHNEEETKLFFYEVRNFHNKYFKSSIDLSYKVDMLDSIDKNYYSESNTMDLNNILDIHNNIDLLHIVFDNPFVKNIIINIMLISDDIYLLDKDNNLVYISLLQFKNLITILNKNNCNIILSFNYDENNDINQSLIINLIRFIENTIGNNDLNNYTFALRVLGVTNLIISKKFKTINHYIENFTEALDKYFLSSKYSWLLYIENIHNVEDVKSLRGLPHEISHKPDTYIIGFDYHHSMIDYNKAIDYYLSLADAVNTMLCGDVGEKIIIGFNYNLTTTDDLKDYTLNYATLFVTSLFFKFKINNYKIAYLNYEKFDKKDKRLKKLYKYTHNTLGLKNSEYLITYIVKSLGKNVLYNNNGIFISKNKNDLFMLLYDNYSEFYNYVANSTMVNFNKKVNYKFDISNISGHYKIIEYTFSISKFGSTIKNKDLINISEEDLFLLSLANRSDMIVNFKDIDNNYNYETSRNFLDYKFIKLQKIY